MYIKVDCFYIGCDLNSSSMYPLHVLIIKRNIFHEDDCYMILIPKADTHYTTKPKKANEMLTAQDLVKRFRERVTLGKYPNLALHFNKSDLRM